MPSSPPEPPPSPDTTPKSSSMPTGAIVATVFAAIWFFVWSFGAASLSYAKYGSIGWAILDFFFATFYYPYYALVLNTPAPTMMGGSRRRMKLW